MPKPYPPEFRRRALDLLESGRSVRDVAVSLGIAGVELAASGTGTGSSTNEDPM